MKRCLTLLLCCLSLVVYAQQLPNSSFENFESGFNGAGKQPVDWRGSNVNKTVAGVNVKKELVSEESNGYIGKCVRIHNESVGAAGITENSPAWITLGTPWNVIEGISTSSATAGTDGGMAFTYRPDTLTVWVRRSYNSQEDANIVVYLWSGTSVGTSYKNKGGGCTSTTHRDEESDIRQQTDRNSCSTTQFATQIGEGSWRSNQQISSWTKVSVPITYYNNQIPEKINVIYSSGNYPNFRQTSGVHSGSTLYVDEMSLSYSSQISEIRINNRVLSGFDKDNHTYTYSLGQGATTVPTVTCYRAGRQLLGSEITINYGAVGQPTTITVRAEDGSSTSTYTINFVGELSTNPRPSGLDINNLPLSSFNPYVYSYNVELPYGTATCPTIDVQYAESGQTSSVLCTQVPGYAVVSVFAENSSFQQDYTLNFTVAALTDNTLQNILLDSVPLEGFSPNKLTYVVDLPVGTTVAPILTGVSAYPQGAQTIVVDNQGLSGVSTISVTPQGSTNTRVYKISYRIITSTNSLLRDIKVGGISIPDFNSSTFTYNYSLPLGTTEIPSITWIQGDAYQSIVLEEGGLEGVTKITVTSQSGAVTIYRLNFSIQKSSISYLKNILLDGVSIDDFDSSVVRYYVQLPIGTTQIPTITWETGDSYQSVILNAGGINGVSRLVVKAQDNSVTTYEILFSVQQANNVSLLDIQIDGVSIQDFDSDLTTYEYILPRGTTHLPSITYTAHDNFQTIRRTDEGVNGETRIIVRAQSGDTRVYVIKFSVLRSSDANLSSILLDGVPLESFNSDSLIYNVVLPSGSVLIPEITFVKSDAAQFVSVTKGSVNSSSSILVIAEDGTEKIYIINFSVLKSENALLNGIFLNNVLIEDFNSNTFEYTYKLPENATQAPIISVSKNSGQVVVISSPYLTGKATIEVTPEVGSKNVYQINFVLNQNSSSYLKDILINGESLSNFISSTLAYNILLPIGSTTLPTIGFVPSDTLQKVNLILGDLFRPSFINVTAEDGTFAQYILNFDVAKSNNAFLQSISVNGQLLNAFSSELLQYSYVLPVGCSTTPVVDYVKQDSVQTVQLINGSVSGTTSLKVTAADEVTTATYEISFSVAPHINQLLSGITVNGELIQNFDPQVFDYVVDIDQDSTLPFIDYIPADSFQHIAVADAGLQGVKILVVAQNGSSSSYSVAFHQSLSSNSTLNNIELFNGSQWNSIADFNKDSLTYNVLLPWHTKTVPSIHPILSHNGQNIQINYGDVTGLTTIIVTAQDGVTTRTYSINYSVEKSSVNSLASISVGSTAIMNFDPDVLDYTITLPYQTTEVPTISWELGLDELGDPIQEQKVTLVQRSLSDISTVTVFAEDGTSRTYSLHFVVDKSQEPNTLSMILVGGQPLNNFSESVTNYSFVLPKGTSEVPAITYVKKYSEQTVLTSVGTPFTSSTLQVISDSNSDSITVYTINFSVSNLSTSSLSGIFVNGSLISDFSAERTSYVVSVTSVPTVTYTTPSGVQVDEKIRNDKHVSLTAYNLNNSDETTYDVYFYYSNDVIPNSDFESWGTAKYNSGAKPSSWVVPADAANKYTYKWGIITYGTYTTGKEVQKKTDGSNNYVYLNTANDHFSICGAIPGMMTLGSMSLSLASGGNSSSSVSGGITFRNTPDAITMRYKQESSHSNVNNMRIVYDLSDGSTSEQKVFTDKTFSGSWKNMSFALNTTIDVPKSMNITINSAHSEDANNLGSLTTWNYSSGLSVDDIALYYNNRLSGIMVNDTAIDQFNADTKQYSVSVASEFVGTPSVLPQGEVSDQAYQFSWSGWNNNQASMDITVIAEDLSTNHYVISFNKPVSSISTLQNLYIDGALVTGFSPSNFKYQFDIPLHSTQCPDVLCVAGSPYQTITSQIVNDNIIITVVAEDGSQSVYTINLNKVASSSTTLWNVALTEGSLNFDVNTLEYTIPLSTNQLVPSLLFNKSIDGQCVTYTSGIESSLIVLSEDGTDSLTYLFHFTYPEVTTSGNLVGLYVDNQLLINFSPSQHTYTIVENDEDIPSTYFIKEYSQDITNQTITFDSIIWNVLGSESNHYVLHIDRPLSSSVDLSSIAYRGVDLPEFNAQTYLYTINRPDSEAVHLRSMTSVKNQKLDVIFDANDSILAFNYVSLAPDTNSSQTTRVQFNTLLSNNCDLSDILVNGSSLVLENGDYRSDAIFNSNQTNYNLTFIVLNPKQNLPSVPSISAIAGAKGQSITLDINGFNNDNLVTVVAEDGTQKIYDLHIDVDPSQCASLSGIIVDGELISNFDSASYSYSIDVIGDKSVNVNYTTYDSYQSISTVSDADSAVIVVVAEDGIHSNKYVVHYNHILSSTSTLETILIDGSELSGFRSDSLYYHILLPVGTVTLPNISVVAGDDNQSISIVSNGVYGATIITVTAQDGSQTIYTIDFDVILSSISSLQMIYLNSETLQSGSHNFSVDQDFDSNITNYVVTLPVGTRQYPIISYRAGDDYESIRVDTLENGHFQIVVLAQDSSFSTIYNIQFNVLKSTNALLNAISLNFESLSTHAVNFTVDRDFDSHTFVYNLQWPIGTSRLPIVTFEAGDSLQTVSVNTFSSLTDSIVITVTAEDSDYVSQYVIHCQLLLSTNAKLSDLFISSISVQGFNPDTLEYWVTLPVGTTQLPEVTWLEGDLYQTITTSNAGVRGDYVINVQAQDSNYSTQYIIHFTVEKSSNAFLANLYADSVAVPGFDMELFNYHLQLAYGIRQVPVITYMPAEITTQNITMHQATSFTDTAKVVVTAEDGLTQHIYRITFEVLPSENALLSGIFLNNELISTQSKNFTADNDFAPDNFTYNIVLPNGTVALPAITWKGQVDDYNSIELVQGDVNSTSTISVVSQDVIHSNSYALNFSVAKSNNAFLTDLKVNGKTVKGFKSSTFEYTLQFPIGTDSAELPTSEDVSYTLGHPGQSVAISQANADVIVLIVTAEDGETFNVYVINLEILLSSNSLLKDLLVDGISIKGFDPYIFDYNYLLFPGAQVLPVEAVKAEESQQVSISTAPVGEFTYIYVSAQDGSESTYSIYFTNSSDNPGNKPRKEDVCWSYLGDGQFKASTRRNNVQVMLFEPSGRFLDKRVLSLVDPNVQICDPSAEGQVFTFDKTGHVYIYVFLTRDGMLIDTGKFVY